MHTSIQQNIPHPMMEEPGLRRCVDHLHQGIQVQGGEVVPSISAETIQCYEKRARELRSAMWINGMGRVARALRNLISRNRSARKERSINLHRLPGGQEPCPN